MRTASVGVGWVEFSQLSSICCLGVSSDLKWVGGWRGVRGEEVGSWLVKYLRVS